MDDPWNDCEDRKPSPAVRAVLVTLCKHANEFGYVSDVPRSQILLEADISKGSFQSAMRWLEAHDEIEYHPGRGRRTSEYYLQDERVLLRYPKRPKNPSSN
jgi:hypothetical protein